MVMQCRAVLYSAARSLKRVAFDRPHATRFRLLFMHVVIAKPLHTFSRHALEHAKHAVAP
ncbi:hypothetical protein MES4922_30130 [Mesorhizobium ventifaucium]|uniref:Uncharacterized protein n=1 Tax=Mesorhizobium ventifaucium TaxID=666020 RepID=A0ABN8JVK7_9HYPH|nr:hypothetical protein MES4922_30130 [Mesorhizobium ventifaucium]